MGPGKFITFEGGDGTGKSTQIQLLEKALNSRGIQTVLTREPGGSPGAEEIRELILKGNPERWDEMTEALLFTAARRNHVETVIKPSVAKGLWVLCDRFSDSTMAYQGLAGGLGRDTVKTLNNLALGDFRPDLTFILDMPFDEGLRRSNERAESEDDPEDRFEKKGEAYHSKLRVAFLEIAALNSKRCKIIDATGTKDEVAARIWDVLKGSLLNA